MRLITKVKNADYWDEVAGDFQERPFHLDPFLGRLKRDAYLDLVRRWAPVQACGCVLKTDLFEEAFGPDTLAPHLARDARRVVAFDISPRIALQALRRSRGAGGSFLSGDARALPFRSGIFDLIVSPSTLDHFPDPRDLGVSLRELHRVLKPGGRLLVSLDNRSNITAPLLLLAHRLGLVPFYLGSFYSPGQMRSELEQAGFKVEDMTAVVHTPRLMAVAAVGAARKIGWGFLRRLVERGLTALQRCERTRLRYLTGSFVAAVATKRDQF